MNIELLKQYIHSLIPMSDNKLQLLAEGFEYTEFSKHDFLLQEGKISKATYFVQEGLIRSYTHDNNGEEVTTHIYTAPCFANDFLSLFKQQACSENFQALSPCKVWQMSFEDVQRHFHTYPEFREFGRMMLVSNYAILHARMIGMIKDTAETRYQKLIQQHPDLFKHVPLKIIASYLGITDSSLSRIRKDLTRK